MEKLRPKQPMMQMLVRRSAACHTMVRCTYLLASFPGRCHGVIRPEVQAIHSLDLFGESVHLNFTFSLASLSMMSRNFGICADLCNFNNVLSMSELNQTCIVHPAFSFGYINSTRFSAPKAQPYPSSGLKFKVLAQVFQFLAKNYRFFSKI